MKLLFKQRFFSWFDSYDIFDETGNTVYVVKGQLSWGHCLKITDTNGNYVGMVKEKIFTLLPRFEIYLGDKYIGCINKELSFFKPKYNIDCNGWHIEGDILGWNYNVYSANDNLIASISKELFNWTDTYSLNIENSQNALCVLMLVLAIDAEKCSNNG